MKNPPEGVPDGLDESDLSGSPKHFWLPSRVAQKTSQSVWDDRCDLSFFRDLQCLVYLPTSGDLVN